jgi:hemerythrin
MGPFKWSSDHSVYLPEMDAEHRTLYLLGDELHKTLVAGADVEVQKPIVTNLLETAEEHFRHEERIMRAMHYTAFAWHKSQHDAVRKRAKSALTRMEKGDSAAAGELLEFLAGWLRDHMGVADRMMGAHLRNHQRFNTSLAS